MKRKILFTFLALIILVANISLANYSTVTMEVVEEPICTIELEENSKFEKRLISKDLTNKEVTIQLQVTNENISTVPKGELVLVLDNSDSMNNPIGDSNKNRKELIFESAKSLISSLLTNNDKLKIGIVKFSTNIEQTKEGTSEDASIVSPLSNDITTLNSAIDTIETNGPRTDLQSGLQLAKTLYSDSSSNKYMIVLTDGVPNVSVGFNTTGTQEDGFYYSQYVIDQTKAELQSITSSNINLITMLTGIENESATTQATGKTFGQIIAEIFGTKESPTAGKFYYVTDSEVESTIKEDIYNSLVPVQKTLKDITVVDYFPKEIIDNFDFSYVSSPNLGDISAKVDTTNNSITWTIPELAPEQTATVQYKLKLKENFNEAIVGKLLDTNEKVDVTYKDFSDKDQSKTSDVTPVLRLTEPPVELPKAGTVLFTTLVILSFGLVAFSLGRLIIFNNKIK